MEFVKSSEITSEGSRLNIEIAMTPTFSSDVSIPIVISGDAVAGTNYTVFSTSIAMSSDETSSNLHISTSSARAGLFGGAGSASVIKNLGLISPHVVNGGVFCWWVQYWKG